MQRDVLLLTEMIDAAEQAQRLAARVTVGDLEADTTATEQLPAFIAELRMVLARITEST